MMPYQDGFCEKPEWDDMDLEVFESDPEALIETRELKGVVYT